LGAPSGQHQEYKGAKGEDMIPQKSSLTLAFCTFEYQCLLLFGEDFFTYNSPRPDLNVLPSPAPSEEPSPQQLPTHETALNEASHIFNQALPQSIPNFEQPQPSPVLDQREQSTPAQVSSISQPHPNLQAELPGVKQIQQYKRQKTM
jgi:hypothetical protein